MPPAITTKRKLKTSLVRKERRFKKGILERIPRRFIFSLYHRVNSEFPIDYKQQEGDKSTKQRTGYSLGIDPDSPPSGLRINQLSPLHPFPLSAISAAKRGPINHGIEDQAEPGHFSSNPVPRRAPDKDLRAIWIEDGLFLAVFGNTHMETVDNSAFFSSQGLKPKAQSAYYI